MTMNIKKHDLIDGDGNELSAIDTSTDVGKAAWLLEYCRIRGFRLGPHIQIGDVILEVEDLRQGTGQQRDPDVDIWAQHGHEEK